MSMDKSAYVHFCFLNCEIWIMDLPTSILTFIQSILQTAAKVIFLKHISAHVTSLLKTFQHFPYNYFQILTMTQRALA